MGAPAPFLVYRDPTGRRRLVELGAATVKVTIGRRAGCEVNLPWDPEVSRVHAELVRLGPEWVLQDDGLSHNGTFVNGERVHGRRRLVAGDAITVGATVIELCGHDPTAARTRDAATAAAAVKLTPAQQRVLDALGRPLRSDPHTAPASNQAIAAELSLSVDTVKGTLSALYERFDLTALAQNEKRAALARLSGSRSA
ncbi:FHA domain-containing protein [Solirubrobacter sp. CPCC 204708]|uniref:FHA domain-containing protein n=1 Tax=Solirubrobacter deserti TaxID=2282478 RepID=A0ABT4RWE5_9ACTN|nr:FHA domain-containing protein [Solirubrobacter deserti]MBE2317552.1 FHA domain-containing protein [Solirubrobacter deserti]MDA0142581.1 FHA domain-containing protein [Solirubrobacter deserti]